MPSSFILHKDSLSVLEQMPDDFAGKFIKAIYQYQITGEVPEMDFTLKMAVIPFINQFKRDIENYSTKCGSNSNSGRIGNLKRWNRDIYKLYENKELTLEQAEEMANCRKLSQIVAPAINESQTIAKVAYNKNDSKSDSDSKNKKENKNIYGVNANILLLVDEFQRLVSDYGEQNAVSAIDYLSNWALEKPVKFKEYKNHNLTLRRWVFKAIGCDVKLEQTISIPHKTYRDKINEELEKKTQLIEIKKEEIDAPEY